MKNITLYIACILLAGFCACNASKGKDDESKTEADKLGWEVGVQAYTFRNFTFFEAIDKIKNLGLHYVEAYPGQKIGNEVEGKIGYDLDKGTREKLLQYLKKQNVKLKAFGVITPKTHAQWDSLFTFADEMGISTITSQPPRDDMPYLSKLTDKYDIDIAIHNHPAPSPYWNPDTLLAVIKGQSSHIGACADLGHWVRSGLDPVKSLKKMEGHVKELHIKDVDSKTKSAEDTIWGTGVIDMAGVVRELKRQDFKGMLSIEYESDPENNMPQIKKSIAYLNQVIENLEGKE